VLAASDSMKNGAARGQLGLDVVGSTRRGRGSTARLWPYVVTHGDGGSSCSDVGERSPEAVAALSDWGCRETTALDSGGRLQTSFKGVRHPGRSTHGAPGVRCRLTGGPALASPPLTSGPCTSTK
jgi:hypothetical protein